VREARPTDLRMVIWLIWDGDGKLQDDGNARDNQIRFLGKVSDEMEDRNLPLAFWLNAKITKSSSTLGSAA
jgi:hypothetical protein